MPALELLSGRSYGLWHGKAKTIEGTTALLGDRGFYLDHAESEFALGCRLWLSRSIGLHDPESRIELLPGGRNPFSECLQSRPSFQNHHGFLGKRIKLSLLKAEPRLIHFSVGGTSLISEHAVIRVADHADFSVLDPAIRSQVKFITQ